MYTALEETTNNEAQSISLWILSKRLKGLEGSLVGLPLQLSLALPG